MVLIILTLKAMPRYLTHGSFEPLVLVELVTKWALCISYSLCLFKSYNVTTHFNRPANKVVNQVTIC